MHVLQREKDAVNAWLVSNRTFHVMRDHPDHGTEILGGMWGGWNRYNDIYRPLRARIVNEIRSHVKVRILNSRRSDLGESGGDTG